jgi:hypothetical protein
MSDYPFFSIADALYGALPIAADNLPDDVPETCSPEPRNYADAERIIQKYDKEYGLETADNNSDKVYSIGEWEKCLWDFATELLRTVHYYESQDIWGEFIQEVEAFSTRVSALCRDHQYESTPVMIDRTPTNSTAAARVRLEPERGHEIYIWGSFDDPREETATVAHRLTCGLWVEVDCVRLPVAA